MSYNWQLDNWPNFTYQSDVIGNPQLAFGIKTGKLSGVIAGLPKELQINTIIEFMVNEALKTSEIEGEFLSRQEVMSSIKKNLGIPEEQPKNIKDQRAKGIAQLMVNIQKTYNNPLTEKMLFQWHTMLMKGNKKIKSGQWRTHYAPMHVISGAIGKEIIHFEAPPSQAVPKEMSNFISWYNNTAPNGNKPIHNPLIRSALAHLYFESIHPFEDGNGRIGRALSEKALSQGIEQPVLLSLSTAMEANKKGYYAALKKAQRSNEVTPWIQYFIQTILEAQENAEQLVHFSLQKTKFFDRFNSQLNERQTKVINKMLDAGPNGFEGGMSAKKYMSITKTSKATATRDLQELVEHGVFVSSGGGRSVRYELKIE